MQWLVVTKIPTISFKAIHPNIPKVKLVESFLLKLLKLADIFLGEARFNFYSSKIVWLELLFCLLTLHPQITSNNPIKPHHCSFIHHYIPLCVRRKIEYYQIQWFTILFAISFWGISHHQINPYPRLYSHYSPIIAPWYPCYISICRYLYPHAGWLNSIWIIRA
jgi:hypothetical protein